MTTRERIANKFLLWDGDPCSEPEGDMQDELDEYDSLREMEKDDD